MPPLPLPDDLRGRVFRGSDVVARGLLTPAGLRSARCTPLFRDCFVDAGVPVDHVVRCRALALVLPPTAAFAGWSAAALHGVEWVDADLPVVVRTPHRQAWGPRRGVTLRRSVGPAPPTVVVRGLRAECRERVVADLACRDAPLRDVVPLLDATLARWPVLGRDPVALLAGRTGSRGVVRGRTALAVADGRAESPAESRLRVDLLLAGLPAPEPQWVVRDASGRFVARVDLGWPGRRVAVEYDGAEHVGDLARMRSDRARLNALVACGWTVLHATADVLRTGPEPVAAVVRAALDRAGGAPTVRLSR